MTDTNEYWDVLIMGAGIAGMVTALRSAQLGLRVLVLEQGHQTEYPCNTRLTSGIFHCALQSVAKSKEDLLNHILGQKRDQTDLANAQVIANHALQGVRWLQSLGIRFIKGAQHYHEFILSPPTLYHQNEGWRHKGGDLLLKRLENSLLASGSSLLRGQKVIQLLDNDRACTGVLTQDDSGKLLRFHAPYTVIADGGYQSNLNLLESGISSKAHQIFQRNAKQSHGDGIRLTQKLGAQIDLNRGFYGHLLSKDAFTNERLWPNPWMDPLASAGVLIHQDGLRLDDEGLGGIYLANALARSKDPLGAFIVLDELIWQQRGRQTLVSPNPMLLVAQAKFFKAHDLITLANLAGIEPDNLQRTIHAHNWGVESKNFLALEPQRTWSHQTQAMQISTPPFYAFPVCAGITYTFGGVLTNDKAQVLNTRLEPIKGLYAVGSCTSGLEGGPYSAYVGGLSKSTVMGLVAAKHIKQTPTQAHDSTTC